MIRALFFVALAFAAVSAQRWPMITVNAAGEIVLQSLTRAQSFQVTPSAITTGPTSSGTASSTTASALTAGVSAYVVTTVSSPATGHGVTLPTPTVGASVVLLQGQTTLTSYTIWTSSSSVFVNSDSTFVSLAAQSRRVTCQAVSTTRWNCIQDPTGDAARNNQRLNTVSTSITGTATTGSVAPTADQSGTAFYATISNAAAIATLTYTIPTCSSSTYGVFYDIYAVSTTAFANVIVLSTTTSAITGAVVATANGATATTSNVALAATATTFTVTFTATAGNSAAIRAVCHSNNNWVVSGVLSGV